MLDTHTVSALANPNGAPRVKAWATLQHEHRLFLSVLTLAEYDQGIHRLEPYHPDRAHYIAARDALAHRFRGRILSVGDAIVFRSSVIAGEVMRRTKRSPPLIDALLAATAIEHDLFLVTRNVKEAQHSGAVVFNPWEDDPARFLLT